MSNWLYLLSFINFIYVLIGILFWKEFLFFSWLLFPAVTMALTMYVKHKTKKKQ